MQRLTAPPLRNARTLEPPASYSFDPLPFGQAALLVYPLARFAVGSLALGLLALGLALVFAGAFQLKRNGAVIASQIIVIGMCAFAALNAMGGGLDASKVLNYWTFLGIFFTANAFLLGRAIKFDHPVLIAICCGVLAANLMVIVFPQLNAFTALRDADDLSQVVDVAGNVRLRGIFYHANEMGLFFTALACVYLPYLKAKPSWPLAAFVAANLLVVLISQSTTSMLVLFMAGLIIFVPTVATAAAASLLSFLILTQLFFAYEVSVFLEEGSFWWRYMIADTVIWSLPFFDADPLAMLRLPNWPHSLLMDFSQVYGAVGATILIGSIGAIVLLARQASTRAGLLVLFCAAMVQPVGAMPTSFFLLTFGLVAQGAGTRNGRLREGSAGHASGLF